MIDKKGRIFSKISIIDLIIVIVVIGLVVSLSSKIFSGHVKQIVSANQPFYVTLKVSNVRDFSLKAVKDGDVFYEDHAGLLGTVINTSSQDAKGIISRNDGTATVGKVDNKYDMFITLECSGSVNDSGFFINGNRQVSAGGDIIVKSNNILTTANVVSISEDKPTK